MTLALVKTGDKQYQYVDSYEIMDAQVSQAQAGYDPLGATATQGCANCQWFLAPGRCVVVAGDISPTGNSALWRAKTPASEPVFLVQIVDAPIDTTSAAKESALPDGSASREGTRDIAVVADHSRTVPDNDPKNTRGKKKPAKAGMDAPTTQDKFQGAVKNTSALERVLSAVKSAFNVESPTVAQAALAPVQSDPAFQLFWTKAIDGSGEDRLRFFTAWTNNFQDREGEIFPEAAHKEYIEWADRNQQYPELWIWHTKGTKYGQVDWLDYTDGFVYASGLIDAGHEDLAVTIAKEDSGVSHGFHGLQRGNEVIQYRSFEISTLPRSNAAVWTTNFNIIGEGAKEMAFTQQKKDYLKSHGLDDVAIAAAETQATQLSKALKDLGVSYKDADIVDDPAPAPVAPAVTNVVVAAPTDGDKAATTAFQAEVLATINKQNEILAALAGGVKSIDDRVKAVERTDDEKIAAAVAAKQVGAPTGVAASKSADNVVSERQVGTDKEWFDSQFLAGLAASAS